MNQYNAIGRLTRDIDIRHTQKGTAVGNGCIAVDSGWGDNKSTAFIDFDVWDKRAESMAQYLHKGSQLAVTGELMQDEWTDKETGAKRTKIKLRISNWSFCGPKDQGNSPQQAAKPAPQDDQDGDEIPF